LKKKERRRKRRKRRVERGRKNKTNGGNYCWIPLRELNSSSVERTGSNDYLARRATNAVEKERERKRKRKKDVRLGALKNTHTQTDIHQYGVVLIFLSFFCSRVCSLPQLALLPLKKKRNNQQKRRRKNPLDNRPC
jgi:hypothetical protein